jgi:DNA-binding transcriptional regulator YdaS (Cro superfamily)
MNARVPKVAKGRRPGRKPAGARRHGCRECPYRAPSGACLDPVLTSGRCGDYVRQVVRGKQRRHLYVIPNDPRTPKQLHSRARFGAASKKYSASLTDEQRDACTAAGAKLRSRRRLGQSGPLTGQQFSIRREYAAQAAESIQSAGKRSKALQTQEISTSTSGTHRGTTVATPEQHRRDMGRAGQDEGRSANAGRRSQKEQLGTEARQLRRLRRQIPRHNRRLRRHPCVSEPQWSHKRCSDPGPLMPPAGRTGVSGSGARLPLELRH